MAAHRQQLSRLEQLVLQVLPKGTQVGQLGQLPGALAPVQKESPLVAHYLLHGLHPLYH